MANTKSAAKRARQTIRRTAANRRVKNKVKNAMKAVRDAVKGGDKSKASEVVVKAQSVLDKAAKTGQIHANKASRHKSQIRVALAGMK